MSSRSSQKVCVVGYALNPKKLRKASIVSSCGNNTNGEGEREEKVSPNPSGPWCGGGLATIVGSSSNYVDGVSFSPLIGGTDFADDAIDNFTKDCNVILHKLTEDIDKEEEKSQAKLKKLEQYLRNHPETVIVDPIENVRHVVNRERTSSCLENVFHKIGEDSTFAQPNFVIFYGALSTVNGEKNDKDKNCITELMKHSNIQYPVICKPLKACGTADSHKMVIVLSENGFDGVKSPFLIQQYYDHDEEFYKCYVIGEDVMVSKRLSLPNLSPHQITLAENGVHSIHFDSRHPYPTLSDFGIDIGDTADTAAEVRDTVQTHDNDTTNFEQVAKEISSEFGLSLFGFDVIVPVENCVPSSSSSKSCTGTDVTFSGRKSLVIDVNFFPSYKEVPDFPSRLRAYLRKASGFPPWIKDEDV